jgi:hypothetical protein
MYRTYDYYKMVLDDLLDKMKEANVNPINKLSGSSTSERCQGVNACATAN